MEAARIDIQPSLVAALPCNDLDVSQAFYPASASLVATPRPATASSPIPPARCCLTGRKFKLVESYNDLDKVAAILSGRVQRGMRSHKSTTHGWKVEGDLRLAELGRRVL